MFICTKSKLWEAENISCHAAQQCCSVGDPFWSYQLNSTANLAHLPRNRAKLRIVKDSNADLTVGN